MSAYIPHAHFQVFGIHESGFMKVMCKWRVKEHRLIGAATRRGCFWEGTDRMPGHLLADKAPSETFLALKLSDGTVPVPLMTNVPVFTVL
jgi:hypothetical protein